MTQTDKASIREVYQISQRLEEKLDAALEKMDIRIANVEKAQANARGINTALGAVAGAIISLVSAFIQRGNH